MGQYTYLLSVILFCGPPLLYVWKRRQRVMKKYEQVFFIVTLLGIPFATADYFALSWKAWNYSTTSTLNIRIGTEVETYLFAAGIFAAVAAATLVSVTAIDRSRRKSRPRRTNTRVLKTKKYVRAT